MNIFITIFLSFSMMGLIDRIRGNKWGLALEYDKGLSTMGTIAVSITGIYCVGITVVKHYAGTISGWTQGLPIDPSIIIGCLLAPDLGAPYVTVGLSSNQNLGYFSGVVVAGCLGQFISFQLPVLLPTLEEKEKSAVMRGFLQGVIAAPVGFFAGGVLLRLSLREILINMSLISIVCFFLAFAFVKAPSAVEKALLVFGKVIAIGSQIMFAVVVVGLFQPAWQLVDNGLVHQVLTILVKMIVIVCGGLVFSKVCLRCFQRQLRWAAKKMHTNEVALIGLILNSVNSLAMVALIPQMDERGKKMNAAFAVSGAYLFGGQMVFVSSIGNKAVFHAYFFSKLAAGIVAVIIAMKGKQRRTILSEGEHKAENIKMYKENI